MFRHHVFGNDRMLLCVFLLCLLGFFWLGKAWDMALLLYLQVFDVPSHATTWLWDGLWFAIWSVALWWVVRKLCQIKLWRYDPNSRQLILGQWHINTWHDLEIHHINQFVGIKAEAVYSAHTAQYGRMILLHQDGVSETEINRIFPNQGGSLNLQSEYQKISKIMQLPMLGLSHIDHAAQGERAAYPTHFRAAAAQTALAAHAQRPSNGILILRGIWATVWAAMGGGLFYAAFGLAENGFLVLLWALLGWAFTAYAWSGGYATWKMYQYNQLDKSYPQKDVPQIHRHLVRQSAEFALFSRKKLLMNTVLLVLIGALILLLNVFGSSGESVFSGMLLVLLIVSALVDIWRNAFLSRKLTFNARTNRLTYHKMNRFLRWLPEKTQAIDEFIGISWEVNNEIWLIGVAGSHDVFLGKSDSAEKIINQIHQKTGLPIVKRVR